MKTPITLLAIVCFFYCATSCKKGDTGNVVPPYDSTHYNDSVKHVAESVLHIADSVKHYKDSVYKIPYGVYSGIDIYNGWFNGDTEYSNDVREYTVAKLPGDSIGFELPGVVLAFKLDSSGQYFIPGNSYQSFACYLHNGYLSFEFHEGDPDFHTTHKFEGGKKL
jgi:hypothetical protein